MQTGPGKLYFIVTTSIYNDSEVRKQQYLTGIRKLQDVLKLHKIEYHKLIIIENNGARSTYLDELGEIVYYTNNNSLPVKNYGIKELIDIRSCIEEYNIRDEDFIVKLTGRYVLEYESEFIQRVKQLPSKSYDCILRYGSYMAPVNYKTKDCITGLIGMRCIYIKHIATPLEHECLEWTWANATYLIEDEYICKMSTLGVNICPQSNTYFLV